MEDFHRSGGMRVLMQELGLKPGPDLGRILKALLDEVPHLRLITTFMGYGLLSLNTQQLLSSALLSAAPEDAAMAVIRAFARGLSSSSIDCCRWAGPTTATWPVRLATDTTGMITQIRTGTDGMIR